MVNLTAILPPPGKRQYFQYRGSLTTPPCLEGLLWHVFQEPSYLSMAQYRKFMLAVNDKYCETQVGRAVGSVGVGGDGVYSVPSGSATVPRRGFQA